MSGRIGHRGLLLPGVGGGVGAWNPADASASIVFSSANKIATTTSGGTNRGCRGITGRTSGVLQFELAANTFVSANAASYFIGVAEAACSLSTQPIFNSLGGKYAALRLNTQLGSDAGYAGAPGAAISEAPHVFGIVVNCSTRAVTFYVDGSAHSSVSYGAGGGAMYPFLHIEGSTGMEFALNTGVGEVVNPVAGALSWD